MKRLTDKEYTGLFKAVESAAILDIDNLTILHYEQDCRSAEYFGGQRTRASVKASKLITLINLLQIKHDCTLVYHAKPYYYSTLPRTVSRFAWAGGAR